MKEDSTNYGENIAQYGLKVLVLAVEKQTGDDLDKGLAKIESLSHKVQSYSGGNPLRDNIRDPYPDVVILEMDGNRGEILEDIKRFVEEHGHRTEVFVTFPEVDLQLVKHLMRSGVRDVLPQPISSQDLIIALSNALARHRSHLAHAMSQKGTVTSFMNTRGNAGGTFLAMNVAFLLAAEFKKHTVLVDLDVQYGTIATDLDLKPDSGILEALQNPERVDAVFLDSLITRDQSGLDVLAAPGDLSPIDSLTARSVSHLISVLTETHDHVVINLPTFLNNGVKQALCLSNPVFVVTQETVPMLRNLQVILERLPLMGVSESRMEVIFNRSGGAVKDVKKKQVYELLGDFPAHRVRNNYKLAAHAQNEGKAVCELSPHSGLSKDIRHIAAQIAATEVAEKSTNKKKTKHWFS